MRKRQKRAFAPFTVSALHEAAHAVVGAHLGIPIASVDVLDCAAQQPNERISGNTTFDDEAVTARGLWPQALIMIFAGEAAESRIPNHAIDGCGDDRPLAVELAKKYLTVPTAELPGFLSGLERQAAELLKDPSLWTRVVHVAAELTSCGTLSAATLSRLLNGDEL